MTTITDEMMRQLFAATKEYCVCILLGTAKRNEPGAEIIVREHGRRNISLREEGLLSIVCPVADGSNVRGISIFNASVADVKSIMDDDPGVKAGIFTYELHPCRSFPGDRLPE